MHNTVKTHRKRYLNKNFHFFSGYLYFYYASAIKESSIINFDELRRRLRAGPRHCLRNIGRQSKSYGWLLCL
jgi:hypothetical protein